MWITTPSAHQWPWVSEKSLQILIFADKAQCHGGRNEFYFKDLSHSTDYIPLHLRWLHSARLSGRTDNMWRLSPGFTAWLITQPGYGGNLLRVRVCAWGYCGYIAGTTAVPHYIHIFNQSTLNFEIALLFHNTTYYFGNTLSRYFHFMLSSESHECVAWSCCW